MIVTNHSYSPFFSFASKTSGIITAEIQPVSGHWDNNKKLKMKLTPPPSLPPPPSSPTSWVTFYQLWAWQVGEGRVRQEHWHRSLCMERFAFYSVCWWAHRCYSYRLQVIGKKKERECVCMIEGEIECVSISACWSAGPILQSCMELDHL